MASRGRTFDVDGSDVDGLRQSECPPCATLSCGDHTQAVEVSLEVEVGIVFGALQLRAHLPTIRKLEVRNVPKH